MWKEARPGDTLVLEIPVKESAHYRIDAVFTKARDYGILQLRVDGQPLGDSIDLFEPYVVMPTGVMHLGSRRLEAGTAQIEPKIVGKDENAADGFIVGLDYLRLTPGG